MSGSLCLKNGILYIGRQAKTATIASYDLDGHPLDTCFQFRDGDVGRSSALGLAVDDDHRIWVADGPSQRVRAFTLFGQEVAVVGGDAEQAEDARGRIGTPVDVVARGIDDDLELLVASAGRRRHALQILHMGSERTLSLPPLGDAHAQFQDLRGVARRGPFVFACEGRAGRVQVFRDGAFHFEFRVGVRGAAAEPNAIVPLEDGRFVVACGGPSSAVLLLDSSGVLTRILANSGSADGCVLEPTDLVVAADENERKTRVAVIDRDGERVQVWNLEGECFGAFTELPPLTGETGPPGPG